MVITELDQVTPEWLDSLLREQGVLSRGAVTAVQLGASETHTATVSPLVISYSADAPPTAPTHLFLKLGRRRIEVDFYNHIAPLMPDPPVVRCYDAAYAADAGRGHLLFADMTATHKEPEGTLPPQRASYEQVIACLASIHAYWWEHPQLDTRVGAVAEDVLGFVIGVAQEAFPAFVDFLGDRLSAERRALYERLFTVWPPPTRQAGTRRTLVHGDPHLWNFLYPRNPATDRILIIDWAAWRVDVGTDDLAYMIAPFWYPERRARQEQDLLRYYHDVLSARGVTGYSWEQCHLDYRVSVISNLFWPIFWWKYGLPQAIWWHNMERLLLAFDDLNCAELLAD